MSKTITFMRKDLYSEKEMDAAIAYISPLFENDGEIFKKMLEDGSIYLEGKSFTYIKNFDGKKLYKIMGNCIGPVVYVRNVLPLEE